MEEIQGFLTFLMKLTLILTHPNYKPYPYLSLNIY